MRCSQPRKHSRLALKFCVANYCIIEPIAKLNKALTCRLPLPTFYGRAYLPHLFIYI